MNYNKILKEEIESQSKKFDVNPNELKEFINELFMFDQSKLLKSMGNQEEILDSKDALPDEYWQEIIENVNQAYQESPSQWDSELKKIKYQILCYKYFTKKELPGLDEIEKTLKVEIKRFFSSLQNYASLDDFRDRFFNLPSDILLSFTRYILNNSKELNKKLLISKYDLKDKVEKLIEERKKIIDKISFISNNNITILDLKNIKNLIDNGVFYEDNLLNRGVNEYIYKLINHPSAMKNIEETFNTTFLKDLRKSIETSNSYLSHITAIKNQESDEYFSINGAQIGRKFDNEIEAVKNKDIDDAVIDDDSIFKEPKGRLNSTGFAFEGGAEGGAEGEDGEDMGGGSAGAGGGFSGGGGGSYSGPTGGDETVDLEGGDEGGGMPEGEDGLPTDFGTEESNDTGDTPDAGGIEEEKPDEKSGE